MNTFNDFFETEIIQTQNTDVDVQSNIDVEPLRFNFKPHEEYLEWEPQGKKMIEDYGLCGRVSYRTPKDDSTLDMRQNKLRIYGEGRFHEDDFARQKDLYFHHGFNISSICIKPKGHGGECTSKPYEYDDEVSISRGMVQKMIAGQENDGGLGGAMNRAGNRWWVIQVNKAIHEAIKAYAVKHGLKTKELNCYVHQNLATGPYMGRLANFDIIAQTSQVERFDKFITLAPGLKPILDQRYSDLVKSWKDIIPVPVNQNGAPCCPLTQEIIKAEDFGQGSKKLNGVQFGHINPKGFDTYATKPYNVILMSRHGNLMQSNASISETLEKMEKTVNAKFRK
jgi:hypothetical protein